MRYVLCSFLLVFIIPVLNAQERTRVSGILLDFQTKEPLSGATIVIEGVQSMEGTASDGFFEFLVSFVGEYVLNITVSDFNVKRIPILLKGKDLDLGTIYLDRDITMEKSDNLIALTDSDLADDEGPSTSSGLLQATRDVFLNRAAFDFGQAFFRVRGYDSQNGQVLINGIPMNKMHDGRPQWNHWGGLNDVARNQQFTNGIEASDHTFGGISGNTNINMRPSGLRNGTRLSVSASNRTYAGRLMATYNSGLQENGLAYAISASRRWAKEGYIEGTLYDAFSVFGSVEYRLDMKNTLHFTGMLASNRRGRSSALTEEVHSLVGSRYNPYWGYQDGKIRNSRERKIVEPLFILNHYYTSENLTLNMGVAYQFGENSRSRLGYYNAPNPDPTYYRYLPSFYINSSIGANFTSANSAKEGFLADPQLNWAQIYTANANGTSAPYVFYDDVASDKQFSINTIGNIKINDKAKMDLGVTYRQLRSDNYAEIQDLLGAAYHDDIDPFSNTANDLDSDVRKVEDAIFGYHYRIEASSLDVFAQLGMRWNQWNGFLATTYSRSGYQREGLFRNGRFLDNSLGKGDKVDFSNYGIKGGLSHALTGRHWIALNGGFMTRPPTLQNLYINPRENNLVVPNIQNETISTVDLSYYIRMPALTGRMTGFYTRFQNTTDVNFFFVDAGVGSDFVQEVITDLDKLHMGIEVGLEYQLSPTVKVTGVAAVGKYLFASDPNVSINFDTAGAEEDLINPEGNIDLGTASIKDYKLAQGPQKAFAVGIEYRDPKYWWIGATMNYLANNYAHISTITRTQSFYIDPETGRPFPDATQENTNRLLGQRPLDNFYLLNMVGGKSWLKKGKYISVFVSINNVFDAVFRTGGYEQGRNGNYGQMKQDHLSGTPSFAPKYWYGYGRTYFLNVAYSF